MPSWPAAEALPSPFFPTEPTHPDRNQPSSPATFYLRCRAGPRSPAVILPHNPAPPRSRAAQPRTSCASPPPCPGSPPHPQPTTSGRRASLGLSNAASRWDPAAMGSGNIASDGIRQQTAKPGTLLTAAISPPSSVPGPDPWPTARRHAAHAREAVQFVGRILSCTYVVGPCLLLPQAS
ncbi:vegetative cell wall protein gp1 [Triticum aestivum]|uniref:vegetative cell wall protein gp1 n=1 Tax=Triticum aestivum TaxID=4565 RepID=UPI001D027431|nr:vegetative cell wall protein gp1-like [Triticum aestivum]